MKMRALIIVISLAALLTACNEAGAGSAQDGGSAAPGSSDVEVATAIIEGDKGPVLVNVEVAETSEERQKGLMFRESLPADSGMVFIFFGGSEGGFWMKNTLIPLSIAFFDQDGEIVRILDMEPCTREPCRIYDPEVSYYGALEVNSGAFDEWGIEEGDTFRMNQ